MTNVITPGAHVMTESMTAGDWFRVASAIVCGLIFGVAVRLFIKKEREIRKRRAGMAAADPYPSPTATMPDDATVTFGLTTDTGNPVWSKPAPDAPPPSTVNHPPHYNAGQVECIDAIESALTPEEFRGFCKGSAMKYVWRERHKGGTVDLGKADWYLARLSKASGNTKCNTK